MVLKEGAILCDGCQAVIARVSPGTPTEGWERLHNLCAKCFVARAAHAV